MQYLTYFIGELNTSFFLLTPFFVLTTFLSYARGTQPQERRRYSVHFLIATVTICTLLFGCGNYLFSLMSISVDSFRVGAGTLLFISAIALSRGQGNVPDPQSGDFAVVPLSMPIAVGPGTIGTLLVMRASAVSFWQVTVSFSALLTALVTIFYLLIISERIERKLGRLGLATVSRLTGLILAAFAAQLIMTGLKNVFMPCTQ